MSRRKNAIIESFNKLDEEELETESPAESDEEENEYEHDDSEELTDEEVIQEVDKLNSNKRATVERSRTRGKAPNLNREGRSTVAREEAQARAPERDRQINWQPADTLDAPPARPGMEQRWIRFQLSNENDPRNWSRKTRERWVPRKMDTVSEDYAPPTLSHGKLGEVIGVSDLILCERPSEIGIARRKFFRAKEQRQMAAATHKHTDKAQRGDHEIEVSVKRDKPTVGRGRRRAEAQED